jgi:uncharacterized repeat protein (TIGR03833 family)
MECRNAKRERIEFTNHGTFTEGIAKDILIKSPAHHHGIKVRLEGGEGGHTKKIF